MLTTRVRPLLVCSTLAVSSACSSSPTTPTTAPSAQPVTVTLVQGTTTPVAGAPLRLAFDAVVEPCLDTPTAGGYLFLVDALRVQQPGEWVATVVVRRGLEL
jgi:hypothetical protein